MISESERQQYNSIEHYEAAIAYFTRIATEWKVESFTTDLSSSPVEFMISLAAAEHKLENIRSRMAAHLESSKATLSPGPLGQFARLFCGPSTEELIRDAKAKHDLLLVEYRTACIAINMLKKQHERAPEKKEALIQYKNTRKHIRMLSEAMNSSGSDDTRPCLSTFDFILNRDFKIILNIISFKKGVSNIIALIDFSPNHAPCIQVRDPSDENQIDLIADALYQFKDAYDPEDITHLTLWEHGGTRRQDPAILRSVRGTYIYVTQDGCSPPFLKSYDKINFLELLKALKPFLTVEQYDQYHNEIDEKFYTSTHVSNPS